MWWDHWYEGSWCSVAPLICCLAGRSAPLCFFCWTQQPQAQAAGCVCVCPSQEEKNLNQVWRQRGHHFSYTSAGSRQLLCSANWKINEMFDKEEYELAKSVGTFCTWKLKTFFYWIQQWSLGIAPYKQEASPSLVFEVEQSPEHGGESLILSWSSSIYDIFLIWTGSKVKLPEVY